MFLAWRRQTSNAIVIAALIVGLTSTMATGTPSSGSQAITTTMLRCCGAIARIHYAANAQCKGTIAILAVGTAMKTQDYDMLSRSIVQASTRNIVVVVLDFNPYDPLKRSPVAYARAVDGVMEQLDTMLPLCDTSNVIVGGHSAGGSSALEALLQELFTTSIAGYMGLDPYYVRPTGDLIPVPALHWGFETTTCGVNVQNAAQAAYQRSSEGFRVFYQLLDPYSHCCFTDAGCMWVCSCATQSDGLLHDIGISVDQFVSAIIEDSRFSRHHFSTETFTLHSSEYTVVIDKEHEVSWMIE